jgi:predicted nucleic acid-binding protein
MVASRVYWDSCCFIALISEEKGRHQDVLSLYRLAEKGELTIVTSALTISEVCKVKCEPVGRPKDSMDPEGDKFLDRFFQNDAFEIVELSPSIGAQARSLFRNYEEIRVTNDAVHLATACLMNVDEMHTFDHRDLLRLNGRVKKSDGDFLTICPPVAINGELF